MKSDTRYLNHWTGRFTRPDPIAAGDAKYPYCEHNPQTLVDPSGLEMRLFWEPAFPRLAQAFGRKTSPIKHVFIVSSPDKKGCKLAEYVDSYTIFSDKDYAERTTNIQLGKLISMYSSMSGGGSLPLELPEGVDERHAFYRIQEYLMKAQEGVYVPTIWDCVVATKRALSREGIKYPDPLGHFASEADMIGFDFAMSLQWDGYYTAKTAFDTFQDSSIGVIATELAIRTLRFGQTGSWDW